MPLGQGFKPQGGTTPKQTPKEADASRKEADAGSKPKKQGYEPKVAGYTRKTDGAAPHEPDGIELLDQLIAEHEGPKNNGPKNAHGPLKDVLPELAKRRTRLSELDTEISNLIKLVEQALRLHLSVRVSSALSEDGEWCEALTFGKWDGKWQLLVETGSVQDPASEWKVTPLLGATREMRTNVFLDGRVQDLVYQAVAQHDEQIKDREAAMRIALELIETLVPADEAPPWEREQTGMLVVQSKRPAELVNAQEKGGKP